MRRIVAWIAAVAGGESLLLALGGGALAPPDLTDPQSWFAWIAARPPDVALLALVRLVALWVGAYLLVALSIGLVLRVARARPLVAVADRLTPAALARLLDHATGVAAAGSVVMGSLAFATSPAVAAGPPVTVAERSPPPAGPPITLRGLSGGPRPDPVPTTTTTVPSPMADVPTTVAPVVPDPATVPPPPADHPPPTPYEPAPTEQPYVRATPGSETPPTEPPAPAPDSRTWTVARGQSFWSIVEAVLGEAWGRPPTAREVDPYWRALIEANRSRLADARNPDLLFTGQVLAVPPPPARAP